MKSLKCIPTLLSVVFAVACLHVSVSAQTTDDKNKLAYISAGGAGVKWDVTATYVTLTLTVSAPDGQVFRREFKRGETPEFTLTDKEGDRLSDGEYTYELRLTPEISSDVRKSLAESRAKGGGDDDAAARATCVSAGCCRPNP